MSSISLQHLIDGALTDAESVRLVDPTATYGIRFATTGAVAQGATGTLASDPTGVYSYDTSGLSSGAYEAAWQIQYPAGVYSYRYQTFSVDDVAPYTGVRLMDVERGLSERVGPYLPIESSANSTTGIVQSLELISSIESGEYSDLYVLRRGRTPDGSAVVPFDAGDRVRQVFEVNLANGQLVVDRAWTIAPVEGEELELHALHPTRELRRAALAGIKRCFFEDRLALTVSSATFEVNLTSSASWITRPMLVRRVEVSQGSAYLPTPMRWSQAYARGGSTYLKLGDYSPSGLLVTALRPAASYVNGATSLAGPNDDDDTLAIDLTYAVAAAHMEAWRVCPSRLLPAAQVGLQPSRQDVIREFNKMTRSRIPPAPWPIGHDEPFLGWGGNRLQVGWD